jgi:hypothetical protein
MLKRGERRVARQRSIVAAPAGAGWGGNPSRHSRPCQRLQPPLFYGHFFAVLAPARVERTFGVEAAVGVGAKIVAQTLE